MPIPTVPPRVPIDEPLNHGTRAATRGVRRSILRLLAGEVGNGSFRFLATVLLARAMAPADYGLLNVAIALSGFGLVACSLGLPELGAREAAIAPERAGWLGGRALSARVTSLTVVGVTGTVVTAAAWPGHVMLVTLAAVMAIIMATSSDWLARGLERMALAAAASTLGGLALLGGAIAITAGRPGTELALTIFVAAEGIRAAVFWLRLHRVLRFRLGFTGARPLLVRARPLALSGLLIYSYYANLDTVVLAATRSQREAGLYSAPYRLFLVFNLVGVFAAYSALPYLARQAAMGAHDAANRLLRALLAGLAAYGVVALALVEIVGPNLLRMLFGTRFGLAFPTFVLLTAGAAWYSVGIPAGYSLIALGQNRRFLVGAGVAGCLNLVLDIVLIPPLGLPGAGLATLIAFVVAANVWLAVRGLISGRSLGVLLALSGSSAGAILIADRAGARLPIGVITLVMGGALAAISIGSRPSSADGAGR